MATRYMTNEQVRRLERFEAECESIKRENEKLKTAIRNLHKVRGRHHTQQACEALFAIIGLTNNIGIEVENDD